jgi:23S rRNA (pseudouridine1915-N3)-methyltransferase
MRVEVLWIGKTRLAGVAELTMEYSRRLARFCEFYSGEIRPNRRRGQARSEEQAMLDRSHDSFRVILDPAGKTSTSAEFTRFIGSARDSGRRLAFFVGGAEGFSEAFRGKASLLLSLSPLTLPHELARVVLLEQLYRAFTTLAGHPYPR